MAIFKVVDKNYNTERDVANLIHYILNPEKLINNIWGTCYLYLYQDHNMTARELIATNQYYGKMQGSIMHHFVLSYSWGEYYIDIDTILRNTVMIIEYFLGGHQCIYALHEDTDNLHSHIIFNSVNCITGMKFPLKREEYEAMVRMLDYNTYCLDYQNKRKYVYHQLVYSN